MLTPDKIVLEPTCGNTGICLAMICRVKGYRLNVRDPGERQRRSARSCCARSAPRSSTPTAPRHERASIKAAADAGRGPDAYFMPYQYGNEKNPRAHYETTGPEILRDLPEIDVFVAGLGTGGTLTGIGRYLKEKKPGVQGRRRGAAPGRPGAGPAQPRGRLHPAGARRVACSTARSSSTRARRSRMTKELTQKEAIFAGISAGAVLKTPQRVAERLDAGNIVCLLADGGWKYLSTEPLVARLR